MSHTLMALGRYRFSIDTAAYQSLKHRQAFRWQSQYRLQRPPALQFMGAGDHSITLNGLIYPHFRGGFKQLDAMRQHALQGKPHLLIDSFGFVWGQWIITHIDEEQAFFQGNGLPLKQHFQMTLQHYGDDDYDHLPNT